MLMRLSHHTISSQLTLYILPAENPTKHFVGDRNLKTAYLQSDLVSIFSPWGLECHRPNAVNQVKSELLSIYIKEF